MKRYVLMFEYDSKKFMDIEKIIIFNENLKRVEEKENRISMFFYGDTSNEELATFMSYFNNLVKKEICNLSISLKTKEVIFEKGINNKSIKLSAQNARDIKNKKFDNINPIHNPQKDNQAETRKIQKHLSVYFFGIFILGIVEKKTVQKQTGNPG